MGAHRHLLTCVGVLFFYVFTVEGKTKLDSLTPQQWPKLMQQARRGDHRAQTRVAIAYERGEVVERDFSKAVEWFQEAANQADTIAAHNLGVMYASGLGVRLSWVE